MYFYQIKCCFYTQNAAILCTGIYCNILYIVYQYILQHLVYCVPLYIVTCCILCTGIYCNILYMYIVYQYILQHLVYCVPLYTATSCMQKITKFPLNNAQTFDSLVKFSIWYLQCGPCSTSVCYAWPTKKKNQMKYNFPIDCCL
jgi:hypothetical protein